MKDETPLEKENSVLRDRIAGLKRYVTHSPGCPKRNGRYIDTPEGRKLVYEPCECRLSEFLEEK